MASSTTTNSSGNDVDLGFLEPDCPPHLLTNRYFPSKVGGKPAWLALANLPTAEQLKCSQCHETMVFLCQVYASQSSVEHCFHRTIYVFVCKTSPTCWRENRSDSIVAFRSQLPRANDFYSHDPPNEDVPLPAVPNVCAVCELCGVRGPFQCANCHRVSYCSQTHQRLHWSYAHKKACKSSEPLPVAVDQKHPFLLPEFELVIESEDAGSDEDDDDDDNNDDKDDDDDDQSEQRRRTEADRLEAEHNAGELAGVSDSELAPFATGEQDAVFAKFRLRCDANGEQVLRYDRGGQPLWISGANQLDAERVPNCELCGGRRAFEFQIMPQMLNHLGEDALDWGIVNVYTCVGNCKVEGGAYAREFCYKQDVQ